MYQKLVKNQHQRMRKRTAPTKSLASLSELICDRREQVRALINKETSVFSVDDDDIANVTSH